MLALWILLWALLGPVGARGQATPPPTASETREIISEALQSASPGSVVTVQLHTSNSVLRAGATPLVVPSNTTLLITGQGSRVTTLTWDANPTTVLISLLPGAKLVLSNLTIGVDAAAAPTSLPAGLNPWPVPFIASAINATAGLTQTGAAIQLVDVLVQLKQCSLLASYQRLVCAYASGGEPTGALLWGIPQVRPGFVYFRAPSPDIRFTALSNVLLTCANSATGGASAPAQPSSIQTSSTPSFSVPGWPTPACLIQPAANESQLQLLLSTVSNATLLPPSSLLVVQLMTNISLNSSAWPRGGVLLSTRVILTGVPNSMQGIYFRGLELDLDNVARFVTVHQQLGTLTVADLCLTNMYFGSDSQFPMSMLVGALWVIHYDRPSSNRTMLFLHNTQLVVPHDLFSYLSYWAAIQTSPVPSVRITADWLLNNVYFGQTVGGADDHVLLFASRQGQGIVWANSTLTDTPFHAPLLLDKTGVNDLVPGSSNVPLNQVKGVYNATQLVSALQAPTVPYLVLLYNMELNASTVQAAWNSSLATTAVTTPVTLLGRPYRGSVILDLGGAASLLSLALPQGSRLVLQRLVVTGLGPAVSTSLLGNLTSLMWAFDFSRKQPMLRLYNVTLVISAAELSVMQQALSPLLLTSNNSLPTVPADPALLSIIQSTWALSNSVSANQTALVLSDVATSGIDGAQITLSSQLPRINYSVSAAYSFNATAAADVLLIAPAAATPTDKGDQGLPAWGIAVIVTGCSLIVVCAGVFAYVWVRRMRQLRQAVDTERAAKTAALEQVEAMTTARHTPSESNSQVYDHHNHHQRTLLGLGQAARAVGALPPPRTNSSIDSQGTLNMGGAPSHDSRATNGLSHRDTASGLLRSGGASGFRLGDGAGGSAGSNKQLASTTSDRSGPLTLSGSTPLPVKAPPELVRGSHDVGNFASLGTFHATTFGSSTYGIKEPMGPTMASVLADPNAPVAVVPAAVAAPPGQQGETSSGARSGKNASNGSNESGTKHALLTGGLAAGDEESAPDDVLTQIINQRKAMQGIDLQQVEFQEVLGQGSFGVVYKGRWRSLTVAIKTLMFQDAGAAKRIRQRAITEAAINTLLTDDNIINTYAYDLRVVGGSGMPDDKHAAHWKLYIIQEYCDAGSLAQAIDAGLLVDPLTNRNNMMCILQIALDIAKGMSYIHAANVIHGDLSSGNVMLRYEGGRDTSCFQAKVGDFGLSRFLEGPEHSHISNARQGTPFYIAPELMDKGIISKDTDVFSFGVLLWEMFCGQPPWRDPDMVPYRHTLNPRTFPYHVPLTCPSEYHALIIACLAEEPKARPRFPELIAHITELLQLLQDALAQRPSIPVQLPARLWEETVPEDSSVNGGARFTPAGVVRAFSSPCNNTPPTRSDSQQINRAATQFFADNRMLGAAGIAAAAAAAAAAATPSITSPATSAPISKRVTSDSPPSVPGFPVAPSVLSGKPTGDSNDYLGALGFPLPGWHSGTGMSWQEETGPSDSLGALMGLAPARESHGNSSGVIKMSVSGNGSISVRPHAVDSARSNAMDVVVERPGQVQANSVGAHNLDTAGGTLQVGQWPNGRGQPAISEQFPQPPPPLSHP